MTPLQKFRADLRAALFPAPYLASAERGAVLAPIVKAAEDAFAEGRPTKKRRARYVRAARMALTKARLEEVRRRIDERARRHTRTGTREQSSWPRQVGLCVRSRAGPPAKVPRHV